MNALSAPTHAADAADWQRLLKNLIARYGPDKGGERFMALKSGRDEDLKSWRALGSRSGGQHD